MDLTAAALNIKSVLSTLLVNYGRMDLQELHLLVVTGSSCYLGTSRAAACHYKA